MSAAPSPSITTTACCGKEWAMPNPMAEAVPFRRRHRDDWGGRRSRTARGRFAGSGNDRLITRSDCKISSRARFASVLVHRSNAAASRLRRELILFAGNPCGRSNPLPSRARRPLPVSDTCLGLSNYVRDLASVVGTVAMDLEVSRAMHDPSICSCCGSSLTPAGPQVR